MGVAVSLHDQLVGPADGLEVVFVEELLADVLAPAVPRSPGRGGEAVLVLIRRVGPEEVTERAGVRHILHAIDASQLIQGINLGRESTMQAEDLVLNLCGDGETLEEIREHLPDEISSVLLEALIIEAVQFIDLSVLVVAPEDGDPAPVFDLEQEDVEEGLHAVEAAIDVIPHEEVVGILRKRGSTGNFPQI